MTRTYDVPDSAAERAWIDADGYEEMYRRSIEDSDGFWQEMAGTLDWFKAPTVTRKYTWDTAGRNIEHTWFEDGELNISHNCLDRHLESRGDQTAIIWEGDDPGDDARISYRELHEKVCRLGTALRSLGVEKGDRVTIYMPMIPEAAVAMLACARIGAVHSVVFGGFASNERGL